MYRTSERAFDWVVDLYGRTLAVALRFRAITLVVLLATIGLTAYLFIRIPKGFFPQQDNGRIQGSITADQDTSFQAMDKIMLPMINSVAADPAVDTVNGFTGGSTYNTARLII
jgi:multidrug efflux pump